MRRVPPARTRGRTWTPERLTARGLIALAALASATLATAQESPAPATDTSAVSAGAGDTATAIAVRGLRDVWEDEPGRRRSRLRIGTGKTYNRVEGLPIHIGPVFTDSTSSRILQVELLGIIRSASDFRWDAGNIGHMARAEVRGPGDHAPSFSITTYDIIDAVENWQMPAGESGIAAFFFRSDYRDHFGRHGAAATATFQPRALGAIAASLAAERWSSREARRALTIFRGGRDWRPNPATDQGRATVATLRWTADTRNDPVHPAAGWLASAEYENGRARSLTLAETSPVARLDAPARSHYGRLLLDVRKYSRISPESQLNLRLVAGGWIHGDELPLQRRFSVGGPATIPGFDFRQITPAPDVGTCSAGEAPPGTPAQCERLLLAQIEYRDELPIRPGTIFGGTPFRIRSAALTLRPVLVAFVDAGRGWLLPPRAGGAPAEQPERLIYRAAVVPPLRTFRTDVGLGIDLGLFGVYVAKAVSEAGQPANFILRARSRF